MFFCFFFAKKGATAVHALIHHQIPEENCHHPPQETKKLAEDSTAACAAAKQVGWPRWRLATIFFSSISSKVDDDCSYIDNIYIYTYYIYII